MHSYLGLGVHFLDGINDTAMASAKHDVGFVPGEVALPSFGLSIFTLLELRGREIKNAYGQAVWIWDASSLYKCPEKASCSDSVGNVSLEMMKGPNPIGS